MTDTLRADLRAIVAALDPVDAQRSVLRRIDSGGTLYRDSGHAPARHLAVYFTLVDLADQAVGALADAATWAAESSSPHQVYRFAVKLTAALNPAVSIA